MAGIIFTLKMGKDSAYELANILKSLEDVALQTVGRSMHLMAENCESNDEKSEFRIMVNKNGEFEEEDIACPECGYSYDE